MSILTVGISVYKNNNAKMLLKALESVTIGQKNA